MTDSVLNDFRIGLRYIDIAARHGISKTTVHKIVKRAGLVGTRSGPTKRPAGPCISCGSTTTAKTRLCRLCRPTRARETTEYELSLTGGRWVPRGGIQVWFPYEVLVIPSRGRPQRVSAGMPVDGTYPSSERSAVLSAGARHKSAPRGAGTPLRGALPTERNTTDS